MRAIIACATVIGLAGCLLPSYDENPASNTGGGGTSAMHGAPACGQSSKLPSKCGACVHEHCCDLAKECGAGTACGKDLLEPITPAADFSPDFDGLLGCMQDHCDAPCAVNWGCVDDYQWPAPNAQVDVGVTVVDFAAVPDKPIEGVDVQACEAIDPACDTGKVASGKTDADGMVQLKIEAGFGGFFSFSGGGYLDSTAQWSEPIHRISGFKQLQLTEAALSALAVIVGVHQKSSEPFKAGAGHLIFRTQNCLPLRYLDNASSPHAEAAGVKVSFEPNDGASRIFYTDPNGGVSVTLDATTRDGVGGAFEAPARNVAVHAVETGSGKEVATGSVRIRAGAIGYAYLLPRSLQ